ncbi:MAG: lipid A deacylase LpxR family protein [Sphingobacteriales bacterium]|nr:MAG: lipid A deacylase LpxR family protein [Sphingobacteriales bacterium]
MMRLFVTGCLLSIAFISKAQVIDNTFSYKHIYNKEGYVRFNYDNDYFTARDRYYTQGLHLEIVSPALGRTFLKRLFPRFKDGYNKIGLAIEHDAYTPTSIQSNFIRYGDRPFAAALMLKPFSISTDNSKQKLSASLSLGVLGPSAGGKEMQTGIHENTGNIIPKGWQYQVHNSPVVNYQLGYERLLFMAGNNFLINADAQARIGTLSNQVGIGGTIMAGLLESPFARNYASKKLHLYFYYRPSVQFIAFDATLQGGMFNNDSPYTIPASDISRFTFSNRAGIAFNYKALSLEYFQVLMTKEFETGRLHRYGGIQIAVGF